MGTLSPIHWVLVAIVVLLVFGPKTLAKMGKSVGKGVRSVNNLKQGFVGDPLKVLTAPLPAEPKRRASGAPPARAETPNAASTETPAALPGEKLADAPQGAAAEKS